MTDKLEDFLGDDVEYIAEAAHDIDDAKKAYQNGVISIEERDEIIRDACQLAKIKASAESYAMKVKAQKLFDIAKVIIKLVK